MNLSVCLSTYLPIYLYTNLPIYMFIYYRLHSICIQISVKYSALQLILIENYSKALKKDHRDEEIEKKKLQEQIVMIE